MPDTQTQQPVSLPTIAPIDPSILKSTNDSIEALKSMIPPEVQVTASPYSYGHDASAVTLPTARERPMHERVAPMNDSVDERRNARQINTWSSVANTVNQFRNKQEADKTAALTTSIATVMKAQQQIDNATQVMQSPTASAQDKQMAQAVIDQNKKVIEGKLTDPKSGKAIQKAFEFANDPEKQHEPEVQAAKAAHKQVQTATKAGLTADTPAEKAVQDHVNGTDAGGQLKTQQAEAQKAVTQQNPSATPYADKFMQSRPASIAANPEYAQQLKMKEDRDKYVTQYIVPKLIDAEVNKEKALITQNGLNNRTEYAGVVGYIKQTRDLINKTQIADARNKTELQKQAMANAAAMMRTQMRIQASLRIANSDLKDQALRQKMAQSALEAADKQVASSTKEVTDLQAAIAANKDKDGKPINPATDAVLQNALNIAKLGNEQAQDMRQKTVTAIQGTPVVNPNDPSLTEATKPYVKVQNATGTAGSSDPTKSVSGTDTGSDSEDDNSDTTGEETQIINNLLGNLSDQ